MSKLGSKKNGMLASVRTGFEKDRDESTHDTLESCYGMLGAHKTYSDSPIVGPAVYYAVNRAFIKAIRPNLPHYDIANETLKLGVI